MGHSQDENVIFVFREKREADQFIQQVIKIARVTLYISLADMLKIRHKNVQPDKEDFNLGYNKSDVRSVKAVRREPSDMWVVTYPKPGRIVLKDGFWHATGVGGA